MGQKVLCLGTSLHANSKALIYTNYLAQNLELELLSKEYHSTFSLEEFLKQEDVILLVLQLTEKQWQKKEIKKYLSICRELRLPYIFIKEWEQPNLSIQNIYAPIGYLVEEKEKGKWTGSFQKFLNSNIYFFKPKDRGSRAARNLKFITDLLDKRDTTYVVVDGKKPTDKSAMEALEIIERSHANNSLLMLSSSRDYGLDDIVFGPKEYHIIKKSTVPVMLINPRDDIYMLCGD